MTMLTPVDPLNTLLETVLFADGTPTNDGDGRDRLAYSTGRMLAAADFDTEQAYHRGRLARALAALHGSGTVAGLRVEYQAADAAHNVEEQLRVHAGLAIDRLGRLIEVPRLACLRLAIWYTQQRASDMRGALKPVAPFNGVVADLFLSFAVCPVGFTPAFAAGPFDALDAVQPSRLRDGYLLSLVPRQESAADLPNLVPQDGWPDLSAIANAAQRRQVLENAIYAAWPTDEASLAASPEVPREYPTGQDQTSVWLARVVMPATQAAAADASPERQAGPVTIDTASRQFVYRARALARMFGL